MWSCRVHDGGLHWDFSSRFRAAPKAAREARSTRHQHPGAGLGLGFRVFTGSPHDAARGWSAASSSSAASACSCCWTPSSVSRREAGEGQMPDGWGAHDSDGHPRDERVAASCLPPLLHAASCGHDFCRTCLVAWAETLPENKPIACPLCRSELAPCAEAVKAFGERVRIAAMLAGSAGERAREQGNNPSRRWGPSPHARARALRRGRRRLRAPEADAREPVPGAGRAAPPRALAARR